MIEFGIENIDSEDLEDVLIEIQISFNIKLEYGELNQANMSLGNFSDLVIQKLQGIDCDDCTNQQAFYKFRKALTHVVKTDNLTATPKTFIKDILPLKNRRALVSQIEHELGFKIDILRPPTWLSTLFLILFVLSLSMLFFNWKIALSGLILCFIGQQINSFYGKEFRYKTIEDVVRNMALKKYFKSRRNQKTFNSTEIETIIISIFETNFGPFNPPLSRETPFIIKYS